MTIRTRFAPSPTGYLHIGGVRTALFNWLLTRRHGGQFILRIDDTDIERNRPEALQPILDGFRWLGIHWDEGPEVGGDFGPYYQSQRSQMYVDAAMRLLDSGHVYPSYETKEELDAAREAVKAQKGNFVFRGKHRDTPAAECRKLYDANPTVLRLKVPEGRTIAIDDLIRGHVEWQGDLISDPAILRADGSPLYNFATVVDDVAMKITHVIRAEEHLTNTAVQILVYEGLKATLPEFAHVPVVNEPNSNKKLTKRRMDQFMTPEIRAKLNQIGYSDEEIDNDPNLNPVTIEFYREMGYLPEAVVNYLARLGWSLDAESEKIPLDVLMANFSLDRVNDSPASFDPDKLLWLAGEYMKELPLEKKVEGVVPYLVRVGLVTEPPHDGGRQTPSAVAPATAHGVCLLHFDEATQHKIRQVVEATGDRMKIFSDILSHAPPFFKDPEYDPKAVEKRLKKDGAAEVLANFRSVLAEAQPFEPAQLEQLLTSFCEERGIKKNLLVHALRVAVTGSSVGLGLYETLVILGREETLRRIDVGLALARP